MKQLTCEMCGSTDLLKQDGVFVCQTCGTKYSVEEAKKMMIEGTVSVSGTVRVDNTDKIKNYYEMAQSAYDAGNKEEAESYCNRIIEIEPQNPEAWFMKGIAAGWQSSLSKLRIEESVQCFSKAIEYSPDETKPDVQHQAADAISEMSLAVISLTCSNFAQSPSESNYNDIQNSVINTFDYTIQLLGKCGITPSEYKHQAAMKMNAAAVKAYSECVLSIFLKEDYPRDWQFENYLTQAGFCQKVIKLAINLADDDYAENITRYENLILLNEHAMEYGAWKTYTEHEFGGFMESMMRAGKHEIVRRGGLVYCKNIVLSLDAKVARRKENDEFHNKIEECKQNIELRKAEEEKQQQAEQNARNNAYWAEHSEEKQKLDAELNCLQEQLKEFESQLLPLEKEINLNKEKLESDVPSEQEKNKIMSEVSKLRAEQGKLGIFKGKEKKALQEQINNLTARLSSINESIENERNEQQKECKAKIRDRKSVV